MIIFNMHVCAYTANGMYYESNHCITPQRAGKPGGLKGEAGILTGEMVYARWGKKALTSNSWEK